MFLVDVCARLHRSTASGPPVSEFMSCVYVAEELSQHLGIWLKEVVGSACVRQRDDVFVQWCSAGDWKG